MSKHRRCDARCHHAKRAHCDCWCGGLFHGAKGAAAREAFAKSYGEGPPVLDPVEAEPLLAGSAKWRLAMQAAREVGR